MKTAQIGVLLVGLTMIISLSACGGTPDHVVPFEEGGPPAWFTEHSDEKPGVIYGYGRSGGEKLEKLASDAARADAQRQLAEFISLKVQAMLEQYLRDMGAAEAGETSRSTEAAMRILTNQRLSGFRGDGKEGWNKARTTYYYRGFLDFENLSKMGEAFKASSELNGALEKVEADRDKFFSKLDEALKNGFDK